MFMYQLKPVNFSPIWYGGDDARLQSPGSIAGLGEFFDNAFTFFNQISRTGRDYSRNCENESGVCYDLSKTSQVLASHWEALDVFEFTTLSKRVFFWQLKYSHLQRTARELVRNWDFLKTRQSLEYWRYPAEELSSLECQKKAQDTV